MVNQPKLLSEETHPYSVQMQLVFGSDIELILDENDIRLPFAGQYTLHIIREHTPAREEIKGKTRIAISLDAFTSACEAESAGQLLTTSLLWFAAHERVTIGFRKFAHERVTNGCRNGCRKSDLFEICDFEICDNRTQSSGLRIEAEAGTFCKVTPDNLASVAGQAFEAQIDISPSVLISMKFFASAKLEENQRSRFIGLITALEALAEQRDYGDEIKQIVSDMADDLESHPILQGSDKDSLRASLSGRIRSLYKESVRQAIRRTVKEHIKDSEETLKFIEQVYGLRSKMLHEGSQDIAEISFDQLETVLIQLYSSILELPLKSRGDI